MHVRVTFALETHPLTDVQRTRFVVVSSAVINARTNALRERDTIDEQRGGRSVHAEDNVMLKAVRHRCALRQISIKPPATNGNVNKG